MNSEGLELLPLWADDVDHRKRVSQSFPGPIDAAAALSRRGTARIVGFWVVARGREAGLGFSLPVDEDFCKTFLLEIEMGVRVLDGLTMAAGTPWSLSRRADETDIEEFETKYSDNGMCFAERNKYDERGAVLL